MAGSVALFERMLGTSTPVLPRLSATLIPSAIRSVMDQHNLTLHDAMTSADELAQRLGARAMPVEGKRRIGVSAGASAPEILVEELIALLKECGVASVRKLPGVEEHVQFPLPVGLGGNEERGSSKERCGSAGAPAAFAPRNRSMLRSSVEL